jgi:hypothetical protein
MLWTPHSHPDTHARGTAMMIHKVHVRPCKTRDSTRPVLQTAVRNRRVRSWACTPRTEGGTVCTCTHSTHGTRALRPLTGAAKEIRVGRTSTLVTQKDLDAEYFTEFRLGASCPSQSPPIPHRLRAAPSYISIISYLRITNFLPRISKCCRVPCVAVLGPCLIAA